MSFDDMMCCIIFALFFSFVAWILTKILPSILRAILVHRGQVDVIKRASEVNKIANSEQILISNLIEIIHN